MGEEGLDCRKPGDTYTVICTTFREEKKTRSTVAAYEGETSRNA